jgi:hypothetical protein
MIIETSTIFKKTEFTPTDPNIYLLSEKHITFSEDETIYTTTFTGLIKEEIIWYEFIIQHVHDFSNINSVLIDREIEKTVEVQKSILTFYKQNPLEYLNDPLQ